MRSDKYCGKRLHREVVEEQKNRAEQLSSILHVEALFVTRVFAYVEVITLPGE